jgi:hypothetical protein
MDQRARLAHPVDGKVSASTQNQELSALLFFSKSVLEDPCGTTWCAHNVRSVCRWSSPSTKCGRSSTPSKNRAGGSSSSCTAPLRVKDVDFACGQVTVRDPKWKHDRVTMLPASVSAELSEQLVRPAALPREDLAAGFGGVWLPDAIDRKFPAASRDWRWADEAG